MFQAESGRFLIADPFLKDPNFLRSVIFLCEHNEEGSFGLVVNRLLPLRVSDLLTDLPNADFPVYYGGPVQTNTLHILHKIPALEEQSQMLMKNLYWGGAIDTITEMIVKNQLNENNIRFYLGYSGWSEGQLDEEIKENTWLTGKGSSELVFMKDPELCWKKALQSLGEPYNQMALYPIDPQLN